LLPKTPKPLNNFNTIYIIKIINLACHYYFEFMV